MNWELDSVLEQSITQMAEGKARVESCLLAYPALADELRPLLVVSEELLAAPKPELSPEARARIEDRLLAAAVASGLVRRERKPLPRPRLRLSISLPKWRLAYSALAAVVAVVLLLTTVFVGAANALPGSLFYPVKLVTEDAWLWVAPAHDEPELHLRFAQRRLEEYQKLTEQGVYDDSLLDAMVAHVDAALTGIEELPPSVALDLLDQAEEVVAEQRDVLGGMLADLPPESRVALDRFLVTTLAQITRMQAMRRAMLPYATATAPVLDLTLVPTDTPEPDESSTATFTPTLVSTETSSGTEPGEVTVTVPTETSTPSATPSATLEAPEEEPTKKTPPGQTKTPEPPGLTKEP